MVTNNCFRSHSGLPTEPEGGRQEVIGNLSSQTSQCHAINTEPKTLAQELGPPRFIRRDYLPGIGRFLARVRLQEQLMGEHPYAYVEGNPVNYVDPTGLIVYQCNSSPNCDPYKELEAILQRIEQLEGMSGTGGGKTWKASSRRRTRCRRSDIM